MKRVKKSDKPPVAPKAHAVAEARPEPVRRKTVVYCRLRVGDVMKLYGVDYVVDFVNECRARAIPLTRRHVSYETVAGKKVEFETDYRSLNISPNSEGKILRRLGDDWRKELR